MEESVVLIGKKSPAEYVVKCIAHFNSGSNKVILKARGKIINKAVKVTNQLLSLLKSVKIGNITIGSEKLAEKEHFVTNITITLVRSTSRG